MTSSSQTPASSDAHARYLGVRHFPCLDGIRCLCIVAVIWHHTRFDGTTFKIETRGYLGVDMFFVLSGFLIVTLLLRERDRKGQISLRNFYMRRTLRIFPLYYGTILAVSVGAFLFAPQGSTAEGLRHDLPYLLTYTINWVEAYSLLGIAWSLAAEEQFYLLWPPIERFLGRYAIVIVVGLIVLSQLIHFHLLDGVLHAVFGFGPDEPAMLKQTTFTPILLGVLLAHLLHKRSTFVALRPVLGARFSSLVSLVGLLALLLFAPFDVSGWPRLSIHLAMTAFLAACVLRSTTLIARALEWTPLRRIGDKIRWIEEQLARSE